MIWGAHPYFWKHPISLKIILEGQGLELKVRFGSDDVPFHFFYVILGSMLIFRDISIGSMGLVVLYLHECWIYMVKS